MAKQILKAQQGAKIIALSPQIDFDWGVNPQPQRRELAGIRFEAQFDRPSGDGDWNASTLPTLGPGRWETPPGVPLGAVLILELAPQEFAILGMGVTLTFRAADGEGKIGIESVQEGQFIEDTWLGGRWLNGDQTHQGRHLRLEADRWSVQRVKLYKY
jgi:hypothetical protein